MPAAKAVKRVSDRWRGRSIMGALITRFEESSKIPRLQPSGLTAPDKEWKDTPMGLRSPHKATAEVSRPLRREDAPCHRFFKFPPRNWPA